MNNLPKFGPKKADHPSVGTKCSRCGIPFKTGDYTTLVELEAGFASQEDAEKAMAGLPYTAEAEEVHYHCAVPAGLDASTLKKRNL